MRQLFALAVLILPSLSVGQAQTAQTITFPTVSDKTLGTEQFQVNPTTTATGFQVTVASTTTSVCTVAQTPSPNTVALVAAGTCSITATQAGGTSAGVTYAPAAPVSQSFKVNAPAPTTQTITFPPPGDKTMGAAPFTIAATTNVAGLQVSLASTTTSVCTVAQTPSPNTVTLVATGTCSITATQAGGTSAGVTYAPAAPVSQSFKVNAQYPGVDVVLGIGSLITGNRTNYTTNSGANVLEGMQIGNTSPQLLAGLAFQLPFNYRTGHSVAKAHNIGRAVNKDGSPVLDNNGNPVVDINADKWHDAYRPFHAFVSLKFSPGTNQSLIGYTFGVTYRIQK